MGKRSKNQIDKYQNKLNRIRNLIDKGELKRALYEVVIYISSYPSDMRGHYLYGKLLLRKNQLQPARREFKLVAEHQDENEVKSLMNLATIAILEGDPNEAITYYKKVIEDSNFQDIYAINKLAHLLRHEKRYNEAIEILSQCPQSTYEIEVEMAKNLSLTGRIDEALSIIETLNPKNRKEEREMALNKGRMAKEKDDYEKANFYYEVAKEASEKDSIYYKSVYEQVKLNLAYERYEEAYNYCEELIKAEQTLKGEVFLLRGEASQALGRYQDAYLDYLTAAETAIDRDIKALAYYYAGSLDFAEGNLLNAETEFKRSISNSRTFNEQAYTKLIGVLFRRLKYDEARKYLERVRRQRPDLVTDDKPLAYMELLIDKREGKKLPQRDTLHYAESQIVKYKEQEAIAHIKSHHQRNGRRRGNFKDSVDIEMLYYDVKSQLTDDNMINEEAMDIFEIQYQSIGYDLEDNLVHKVRVVVFPHTRNILTMYPGARATVPSKKQMNEKYSLKKVKRRITNE